MLKTPFFILALLLVVLPAMGSTYVKSHEEFALMTKSQQDEFIIKTMELVVEMETQYQYETAKYGFDLERYKKYVNTILKIKSFLISEAYAETRSVPNPNVKMRFASWTDYARSFQKLSGSDRNEFCIFAGWISKPVELSKDQNSKTICSHPDFINGDEANRNSAQTMSEWTKGYPDPKESSGCGKNDRTKIQCNPAIFGFKDSAKGSLFCVNASNGAHNSAYFCMKKALDDSPSHEGDSPEVRLGVLRKNLIANPKMFESIQNFVYKTCVCERSDLKQNVKKNFSAQYHNYIRPHRTCYGMMNMIAETTKKDCEVPGSKMDTTILQNLQKFTEENIKADTSETQIDALYTSFINKVKTDSPAQYKYMCQGGEKPKEEQEEPKEDESQCFADCVFKDKSKNEYECTFAPAKIEGGKPFKKVIVVTNTEEEISVEKKEFKAGLTGKINCAPTFPQEEKAPEYFCKSADCKKEGEKFSCDIKIGVKESEKEFSQKVSTDKKGTLDLKQVDIGDNKKVDVVCEAPKFPEDEKTPEVPDFELTSECGDASCTVKITPKGTVKHDGWTYDWEIKNKPADVVEGWKDPKTQGPVVSGSNDPGQVSRPGNVDSVTQKRASADYEVCATMKKDKAKDVGPKCKPIPKLEAKKEQVKQQPTPQRQGPMNNMNRGGPMPPQIQMRGMSNTSADGIR